MAIAASTGVSPLVGRMALSDASLLRDTCSRRIHLAPKGCILLSSDSDSSSIGGLHNLNRGGGCHAHVNNLYGHRGQVQISGIKDTYIQSTYIQITYVVFEDHQNT